MIAIDSMFSITIYTPSLFIRHIQLIFNAAERFSMIRDFNFHLRQWSIMAQAKLKVLTKVMAPPFVYGFGSSDGLFYAA